MKKVLVLMGVVLVVLFVTDAKAFRVTTADAGGADAELREEAATSNRGASTELASRVECNLDEFGSEMTGGRNSLMYLKFGVAGITAQDLAGDITVRLTVRNNNQINTGRIIDNDGFAPLFENTGMDYWVLDPTTAGANWDELTIAPTTLGTTLVQAPGYTYDGLCATKATDNAALTYLGFNQFNIGGDGWETTSASFSVGAAFDFTLGAGSALHNAIVAAQATGHQTLTVVVGCHHGGIASTADVEGEADNDWTNFNYLFNPKEMLTLNSDPDSRWYKWAASNANNDYSPMLTNEPHVIPEPATMVLLGCGALALLRKRH